MWLRNKPSNYFYNDDQELNKNKEKERNTFVAEHFLAGIIKEYGKYLVFTDGVTWYPI